MIRREIKRTNRACVFCENKTHPNYKESSVLQKFLTERGKIVSRLRTGICNKHQRELEKAVKNARFMAFLPYIIRA